jgi:hypothetical protein
MLAGEIPELQAYPLVHAFVVQIVHLHLADVRCMMQLPRFDVEKADVEHKLGLGCKLDAGCNFASVAVLCNIASGISASIFKPRSVWKKKNKQKQQIKTGDLFQRLFWNFYPWEQGEQRLVKSRKIYEFLRNPFAHSLGLQDPHRDHIFIGKTGLQGKNRGLTHAELDELERSQCRPQWLPRGIEHVGVQWNICAEGFYRGVFHLIWNLAKNHDQMRRAQRRFERRIFLHSREK